MKRLTILSFIAVFALTFAVAPAMARISMSGDVASQVQSLEFDEGGAVGSGDTNAEFGFNDPAFNLHIYGDVASGVDAYVELQSRVGQGDNNASTGDVEINEAYITLDSLLSAADVKVGQFEVDFGNQHLRRSDNADVQNNPLIGNSLVDPYAVQSGVEFSGQADRFAWSAAVTNGANSADFSNNTGLGYMAKVWGDITPALSAALSFYAANHDATSVTNSDLIGQAGGEAYQFSGNSQTQVSRNGFGNPFNVSSADVTAWQLDASYDFAAYNVPASIDAWYGTWENDPVAGGNDQEMDYYGALVQYDVSPQAYIAGRYELASNETSGFNINEESERIQVGVGYELNSSTLAKLEYVTQENDANGPANNSGNNNEEFDGVIGELSVNF